MIEHVFRRATMCNVLNEVFVATCDEEIRKVVESFGGRALMTSPEHERASDRVAEAAEQIKADTVVMIQGDEPTITPEMIVSALEGMLRDNTVSCVNLVRRIVSRQEYIDPNTIKVVRNARMDALYFSRTPLPALRADDFSETDVFKQVCVIPFRRDFLTQFARLAPGPLERAESIDMLRILEHGDQVRLVETEVYTHAVDTPDDLQSVETLMKDDPLVLRY